MDGIKLSDQNLFTNDDVETAKNKIRSIVYSESSTNLTSYQNILEGKSTLNSYEFEFYPQRNGTSIQAKYGLTTLGLILGIILLIPGVIFGAIIFILWYLKMDEVKSALGRAFPQYVPPQYAYPQSQTPPPQEPANEESTHSTQGDPKTPPPPE